jgi:hypothetical protein
VLGLSELLKRDLGPEADRERRDAVVGDPGEIEEALPPSGGDRPDEARVMAEQTVGVDRAGGGVSEVAGVQDTALASYSSTW